MIPATDLLRLLRNITDQWEVGSRLQDVYASGPAGNWAGFEFRAELDTQDLACLLRIASGEVWGDGLADVDLRRIEEEWRAPLKRANEA